MNIINPSSSSEAQGAQAPSAADQVTAGNKAAATGAPAESKVTGATKIHSLEELKKKSPKLYDQMMQGIAHQIIGNLSQSQHRVIEKMRELRNS